MKRLAGKIQRIIGETKYGFSNSGSTISYSGACVSLSDIAQGAGDTARTGDQLNVVRLYLDYAIFPGDATNLVRVIIFQWKPIDTSAPAPSDILQSVGNAYAPLSTYNHDSRFQKHVLYDALHSVDTYHPQIKKKVIIKKFKPNRIQYTAGTVTGQNKIYLLTISDSAASTHPSISLHTKILYKDA